MKLLIIEDDQHLSETIRETAQVMFETAQAFDGEEGLFLASQNIFDIIILDIMLPSLNGYEVLEQLRKQGITTPVILLTAKDGIDDKIHGFKKGADDYLVKPFHREELLLRLEALVRRTVGDFREQTLRFKDLHVNTKNCQVSIGEEIIKLTYENIAGYNRLRDKSASGRSASSPLADNEPDHCSRRYLFPEAAAVYEHEIAPEYR